MPLMIRCAVCDEKVLFLFLEMHYEEHNQEQEKTCQKS